MIIFRAAMITQSLVLLLFMLPFTATGVQKPAAQEPSVRNGFWSIQLENDLWGSNDDRFYSHGTQISHASVESPPQFLENLADYMPFYRKSDIGIHGYSIGQKIFTPENTEVEQLQVNDRPYAGWAYFNAGVAHRFEGDENYRRINGLVLTIGIVGPHSYADKVQKEFHRLIDVGIPRGWDNQLHDELGVNLSYTHGWRYLFPVLHPRQVELGFHGGLALGNVYTYAAAGSMIRWGTHLQNDIGPPTISPGFPGVPAFRPGPKTNWYIFCGVEERAMARNIFLDGNTFRDSHSVDKERFVTDVQFGVAFHYRNARLSISNVWRSKEYENQREPARYGAINLTFYL